MKNSHIYKGSCLCGACRYEVEGDFDHFYLCHCEKCRKDTGSAHAANLFSNTAKLKWIKGENLVRTYNHQSQGHIKSFCTICGSALPNIQMNGQLIMVPAGSIDGDMNMRPQGHIYYKSKANWDESLEDVTIYDVLPKTNDKD